MRVIACPDKFKGTASAEQVAEAIAVAVVAAGHTSVECPMADGGEGILTALGGPNRASTVTGPLGQPTDAEWRCADGTAVIEMAQSSGLVLAGGKERNDPLAATTAGVGELIIQAIDEGATRIIVGLGGSATTDGGLGAVDVLGSPARIAEVDVLVACDVRTRFTDAAAVFGPQKGATPEQVVELTERLNGLVERYGAEFGVDVSLLERAGAAGGLAGGLAALGATLVDGFQLVSELTGFDGALAGADLVVTGEGLIDEETFNGKVVGGIAALAKAQGIPVLAVAGHVLEQATAAAPSGIEFISLTTEFGHERAMTETEAAITKAVANWLSQR